MKWTPNKSERLGWTMLKAPYTHEARQWCRNNYPELQWWYCWMTGYFYFEDSKVACEFMIRHGAL